jgi:type VI secretion system secreted protein Hcp
MRGAYSAVTVPGEMIDCFLDLDGIPGESKDAKHKDEIDVLAFSWGVSQSGTASSGGGGGAGKASFDDLLLVARTSKASPLLWAACASGEHIKSAVLSCRKAGKAPQEFLTITLSDVLVSSYELDGSDDEPPLDQFALSYAKIETQYVPTGASGKAKPPVRAGWDLKAAKKA